MNTFQILQFTVMNVLMCVDIKSVVKVLPLMRIEKVPLSQRYFVGLINLAGKNVPIVDLAMMMGMERAASYSIEMPILLCSNGKDEMGMIVDAVHGIENATESQIDQLTELQNTASPFLGTITLENKLALLIDMQKIFIYLTANGNSELNSGLSLNREKLVHE